MRVRVHPYKMGSKSAKVLALGIGAKRIFPDDRSRFVARTTDVIVNWGASSLSPRLSRGRIINPPEAIELASNKLRAFNTFQYNDVPTPRFTNDSSVAGTWIQEGAIVFCRTKLSGHSGNGIVVATSEDELVRAPLYTEGLDKKKEYRLHVVGERVVDFQQKRKRSQEDGQEELVFDEHIWNHGTNRVFCRRNVVVPETAQEIAVKAIKALGLDFGAVDMVLDTSGDWYVLEVNTAPGLEGTTGDTYVYNINQLVQGGIDAN